MSKRKIIAIALFAIIPALGACESPTAPEVPQYRQVDVESQPDPRGGGDHRGVLW